MTKLQNRRQRQMEEAQRIPNGLVPTLWYVSIDDIKRVAATLKPGPKAK